MITQVLESSAVWGVLLTLAAFALGALINRITGKAIFNPLLLGSIFVIIFLSVCKIPYADYKASAAPVNYLLLPATVPWPSRCMKSGTCSGRTPPPSSPASRLAHWSAWAVPLLLPALDLTKEQYATLLPKSVTTAISMDVAAELGGIAALTGAIVILTGIAAACWPKRCARCSTSPTPSPRVWASAPRPMPWVPARPCRWVRWRVP